MTKESFSRKGFEYHDLKKQAPAETGTKIEIVSPKNMGSQSINFARMVNTANKQRNS